MGPQLPDNADDIFMAIKSAVLQDGWAIARPLLDYWLKMLLFVGASLVRNFSAYDSTTGQPIASTEHIAICKKTVDVIDRVRAEGPNLPHSELGSTCEEDTRRSFLVHSLRTQTRVRHLLDDS